MAEEFDDLIVLTDENGEESTWEHIGTFDVGGNCYVAMLSLDGCGCEDDAGRTGKEDRAVPERDQDTVPGERAVKGEDRRGFHGQCRR